MSESAAPDDQEAAKVFGNFFSGLFGLILWLKQPKHLTIVSMTIALTGGVTTILNRLDTPKPPTIEKMDASLTNSAKIIARQDSTDKKIDMMVAAMGTLVAFSSKQQVSLDIIMADLMKDPRIRQIERARQDSARRANDPRPFTYISAQRPGGPL